MSRGAKDSGKQGRQAAALSIFIVLVTIATTSRAAKWAGIACSVGAAFVGLYFLALGLRTRRRKHRNGLRRRHGK